MAFMPRHASDIRIVIAPPHPLTGRFRELDRNRQGPHAEFAEMLRRDDRMRGRVLDVGCGCDWPESEPIRRVLQECGRLDGVEPAPCVADHPGLTDRFCARFEDAGVSPGAYDALFTFFVAEHIERAGPFLAKAHEALRPGGVMYAYTPHALHPFALISRTIQAVKMKRTWRRRSAAKINEYPAYYRVNRVGSVARAAGDAGFASAEFHYLPCVQWDGYFPRPLRVLPHLYDRLIGIRFRRAAQLLIFKLEKAGDP